MLGLGRAPLLKVAWGWVGHRDGEAGGQRRLRVQKPMGRKDKRRVVFAVRLLPQRAQGKFRIRNILEIFRNAMNKNELLQTLSGLHYICF